MRFDYRIPKTEDDFEVFGCELLKVHWKLPQLQRYVHRGESQDGVDIFDPSQTRPIRGAQCKRHEPWMTIPPKEIVDEVEKAKSHVPLLDHFTILTTARKSKQADKCVAEINTRHQRDGLFTVEVLTWDQIELLLDKYSEVADLIYNTIPGRTVARFQQELVAIRVAIEPSPHGSLDVVDAELDSIKNETERHALDLALHIADRLQERLGDKLTPRQRWRLMSLRANILLEKGKLEEAGHLLVQAKQYQPEEEKALVNEALGLELIGDTTRAHSLANSLRARFPGRHDLVALWVRTAPADISFSEVEKEAAHFADRECDVAIALAMRALIHDEVARASHHGRMATQLEPDVPQAWLVLGYAMHACASAEAGRETLLREAEASYSKAIDLAHAHGNLHIEAAAHLNRGIARDVLKEPEAEADLLIARRLDPKDGDIPRKHAIHLANIGRLDKAVEEAQEATRIKPGNHATLTLATILWQRNQDKDREQALAMCLEMAHGASTEAFDDLLETTTAALVEFKRWDEARSLISGLSAEKVSALSRSTHLAYIFLAQGDRVQAERLARETQADIPEGAKTGDLRRLARLLGRLELFGLALPLFLRVSELKQFDDDAEMLLICAHRLRNHRVILDVCGKLRAAGADDSRVVNAEIDILQFYDRPAAIEILKSYVALHPEDRLTRLRLSALAMQSDQTELVCTDQNKFPPIEELDPGTFGRMAVGVLAGAERWPDALRYAYDILRRNLDDPDAHMLFFGVMLHSEHEGYRIQSCSTAVPDMAITYRELGQQELHRVIIEESHPDHLLDEYSPEHPRLRTILEKKVGDEFSLSSAGIQERKGTIVSINHKYIARFQKSLDEFQARFPDRQEMQQIRLSREGQDGNEQLDLSPIIASLDQRRRHVLQAVRAYRSRPTPLHLLSEVVGNNAFEVMEHLTSSDAEMRWCCAGNVVEREQALKVCRDNSTLVLTISALFTIWRLELLDLLRRWQSRKLLISQTTFDQLRHIVESQPAQARRSVSTNEQGQIIAQEASPEAQRQNADSLERLLAFVREQCVRVPVPEAAHLEPEPREYLTEAFGQDGLESIVLAAKTGNVLWCDDMTLSIPARKDFKSGRWTWTQALLAVAVEQGIITQNEFDDYSARLVGMNYSFTWLNAAVVLRAGAMAQWSCEARPLRQAIRHFGTKSIDVRLRLMMAAQSIIAVCRTVHSPFTRQAFVLAVLNQLGSRRLALALAESPALIFDLNAPVAEEVNLTIHLWLRGPRAI